MKKVLMVFIIGLLVASGASYFGLQWKVNKAVEDVFQGIRPFVDAKFDNVKVGLDGRISINKLSFYEANSQTNIVIESVGLATSNLLETIQLEKSLKKGNLPKSLVVDMRGVDFDISRSFFSQANAVFSSSKLNEIAVLGCGQTESLNPMMLYDLGFNNLVMDIEVGYNYEMALDEFVNTTMISVDGMGAIEVKQTILGMLEIMDNFQNALTFDYTNVNTQRMQVDIRDFGYNNKFVEYCAGKAKLKNDEWRDLHTNMVVSALNQLEFNAAFDIKEMYNTFIQPGVEVMFTLQPLPDFELSQLEIYSLQDLISLSNLQVQLNQNELDLAGLSYNPDSYDQLNLKAVRLVHGMALDKDQATEQVANVQPTERKLVLVPNSELSRYVGRKASVERTDGQVFIGTITQVRNNQVLLRIRQGSGYTDIPVNLRQVKQAKLYPES
jgi:hypothetical protein